MSTSRSVWCAALALVACAGHGRATPPAGAAGGAAVRTELDGGVAADGPASPSAATSDASAASTTDAGPMTAADEMRRMVTPRSAAVIAEDLARLAASRALFDRLAAEHGGR